MDINIDITIYIDTDAIAGRVMYKNNDRPFVVAPFRKGSSWLEHFADNYPIIYEAVEKDVWAWIRDYLDPYEAEFIDGDYLDNIYKEVIEKIIITKED